MARVHFGTCSWNFPSWEGLVYAPGDTRSLLEQYAARYDTVEVDRWFWSLFDGSAPRLPSPADVAEYRRAVPDGFRFTVKAPNSLTLTHFRPRSKADPLVPNPHFLSPALYAQFLSLLEPLGETLGPVILQFGYLNRQHLSGQSELLDRLEAFLEAAPVGPRIALELRNPHWLNRRLGEFMAGHGLLPVLLQGYWMPPVVEVHAQLREWLDRAGGAVIRLHGPDREGMDRESGQRWDRLLVQRDEELAGIVGMMGELLAEGAEIFLNANNHYEGCAPLTLARLLEMLPAEWREQGWVA